MPKRKKQTQQQQPPHQQPPLTEREETGDEEDGSPIGEESERGVHMPVSWARRGASRRKCAGEGALTEGGRAHALGRGLGEACPE